MGNFFNCITDGGVPISDVETVQRTTTTCHLCNIAMRLGRKVQWDPNTETFLNDDEATDYGLGLFIDEQRGLKRIHHGGADIAHRSMLAYYPEIGAGITF